MKVREVNVIDDYYSSGIEKEPGSVCYTCKYCYIRRFMSSRCVIESICMYKNVNASVDKYSGCDKYKKGWFNTLKYNSDYRNKVKKEAYCKRIDDMRESMNYKRNEN